MNLHIIYLYVSRHQGIDIALIKNKVVYIKITSKNTCSDALSVSFHEYS